MHDNSGLLFIFSIIPPESDLHDTKQIDIQFNYETENYIYTNITNKYKVLCKGINMEVEYIHILVGAYS